MSNLWAIYGNSCSFELRHELFFCLNTNDHEFEHELFLSLEHELSLINHEFCHELNLWVIHGQFMEIRVHLNLDMNYSFVWIRMATNYPRIWTRIFLSLEHELSLINHKLCHELNLWVIYGQFMVIRVHLNLDMNYSFVWTRMTTNYPRIWPRIKFMSNLWAIYGNSCSFELRHELFFCLNTNDHELSTNLTTNYSWTWNMNYR